MSKIDSKFSIKAFILALFTSILGIATAAPLATMDDYVWKVLDPVTNSNYFDNNCEYDSIVSHKKCLQKDLQNHDNKLSKKWGLSDRISREKDTIYIKVPNRDLPLVFRDEQYFIDAQSHSYFSLYDYDKPRQLLYLLRSFPEGDNTILVDLKTGFNQEFFGIDISVSPDEQRIATVERYINEENITIWQKQNDGNYQASVASEFAALKPHLAFYQNQDQRYYFEDVDIEWQGQDSVFVDFYYPINVTDDVGYRVRFNYIKPDPKSDWQLIPIK